MNTARLTVPSHELRDSQVLCVRESCSQQPLPVQFAAHVWVHIMHDFGVEEEVPEALRLGLGHQRQQRGRRMPFAGAFLGRMCLQWEEEEEEQENGGRSTARNSSLSVCLLACLSRTSSSCSAGMMRWMTKWCTFSTRWSPWWLRRQGTGDDGARRASSARPIDMRKRGKRWVEER